MTKLLATCVFGLFSALTAIADEIPSAPLFSATLTDLDDKPAALARYKGKPLVVNFWARWCAPCRAEIPELARFGKEHKGKIEVLGIGIEDEAAPAKDFARKYAMDYAVVVAREKGIPLMQALGNTRGGLPYTLFIDRDGKVVGQRLGLLRKSDLDSASELLLKK